MKKNKGCVPLLRDIRKILLIMKITAVLIFVLCIHSFANSYGQTQKINLSMENASFREVIERLEKESGYYVVIKYDQNILDKRVDVNFRKATVIEILDDLLNDTGLGYKIIDKYIAISALSDVNAPDKQLKTISGKITDSSGASLPGVSVFVKGTTTGLVADSNGKYSLTNVPENATLVFSFVGMLTQEIAIGNKTTINVVLEENTVGIEEVIAIGYGTMKKSDLTGSISSISSKDLQKTMITTPDQALQGRVAGVQVRTDSHAPGGGISVQVRGTSSLSASGQPLYVVDGFPISNEFVVVGPADVGDGTAAPNPLNSIDPSNIESIEVLKDASATAIYGSRATNGVVLITTKRGAGGKTKFDFEVSHAVEQCSKYLEVLGAKEWAGIVNEANDQNGKAHTFTDAAIAAMGEGTDWQREVFRTAQTKKYKMAISGGTPDLRYMIAGNYSDQDGIVRKHKL